MEACKKNSSETKKFFKFHATVLYDNRRQECSTPELAQPFKQVDICTNSIVSKWLSFTKSICFESPKRTIHLCNKPKLISKKGQKQTSVTINWTSKI